MSDGRSVMLFEEEENERKIRHQHLRNKIDEITDEKLYETFKEMIERINIIEKTAYGNNILFIHVNNLKNDLESFFD